ncbi:acyl carrier protein, partial [Gordonia sp. (in: high G+C Gram-positive bacteria)]
SWPDLRALLSMTGSAALLAEVPDGAAASATPEPATEPAATAELAASAEGSAEEPVVAAVDMAAAAPPIDPPADLTAGLVDELAVALGLAAAEVDPRVPLVALGMDSLQALDFRKRVQTSLARELPVEAILGGASLDEVVTLMGASA